MATEKRLIDANDLKKEMLEENPYIHVGPFGYCACSPKTDGELVFKRKDVLRAIDLAPTVDAVVVVRCKVCFYGYRNLICTNPRCTKSFYGCPVPPDHYCSFGERIPDD